MTESDREYYRGRMAAEEKAARAAAHPVAAGRHRELAEQYAGLIAVGERLRAA